MFNFQIIYIKNELESKNMNFIFRRFVDKVCNLIAKDFRKENIKNYSMEKQKKLLILKIKN